MKKLKLFSVLIFAVVIAPFFFGCGEATFDTTPWETSENTVEEIVEKFDDAKNFLLEVGLPVKFTTETTYTFSKKLDDSGEDKVVKDTTTTLLYYESNTPTVAEVVKTRFEDNEKKNETSTIYYNNEGMSYTTITTFEDNKSEKKYSATSILKNDERTFKEILSKVIFRADDNALTSIKQKTYKEVDYYQFLSSSSSIDGGLALLNDKFNENKDLYSEPNFYEVMDKRHDYVTNFSSEFGIDKIGYLKYFTFNYSVENSNDVRPGERKTYLVVSSVTKLDEYGQTLEKPQDIEDKNFYSAHTFVDLVKQDGTYISYRDNLTNEYNNITAYKVAGGYFANVQSHDSTTNVVEYNYYFEEIENGFKGYLLDLNNKTYKETNKQFLFLQFDFTKSYLTKRNSEYLFGTSDNYTSITVQDNKILSIKTKDSTEWYVVEYGKDMGIFDGVDMTTFTLSEE